jgi:hypothetical protein
VAVGTDEAPFAGESGAYFKLVIDAAARARAAHLHESLVLSRLQDGRDDARGEEGGDKDEVSQRDEESDEREAPEHAERVERAGKPLGGAFDG